MGVVGRSNDEQSTLWNDLAGRGWVEAQHITDRMFKPFEDALVQAVLARRRAHVLDVGCGTGSTTLAVARVLGKGGECIGVDISDPMIAAARARAAQEGTLAQFIRADAQTYDFEAERFDMIISRFGVMF